MSDPVAKPANPPVTLQRRLWEILEPARAGDHVSRWFDIGLLLLITLNVVAVLLESVDAFRLEWATALHGFEAVSIVAFTIEYLLRLHTCTADSRFRGPVTGRMRFALTPAALVDFLSLAPFYLPFLGVDLRVLRVLRLFRVYRMTRVGAFHRALPLILNVLRKRRAELSVCLTLLLLLLVIASTLMYFVEHEAQPDKFASIPAAMYWAVATLTTVGYGDIVPVTAWGKVLAGVFAILGISFFALPTSILGAGFLEELQRTRKSVCPHCGRDLHDSGM